MALPNGHLRITVTIAPANRLVAIWRHITRLEPIREDMHAHACHRTDRLRVKAPENGVKPHGIEAGMRVIFGPNQFRIDAIDAGWLICSRIGSPPIKGGG